MRTRQAFGLAIFSGSPASAVEWIFERCSASFTVVLTLNVDHAMKVTNCSSPELKDLYESSGRLVTMDSAPLQALAWLRGARFIQRCTGADLCEPLIQKFIEHSLRVVVIAPDREVEKMTTTSAFSQVTPLVAPDFRISDPSGWVVTNWQQLREADLIVFGIGGPSQERVAVALREQGYHGVVALFGGAISFLLGTKPRAPKFVSRAGFEWLYRLSTERGQLLSRYAGNFRWLVINGFKFSVGGK